jgi:ABC-2 type transport system ATP-binding protein
VSDSQNPVTLSARDLARNFGVHPAVRGIRLELRRGEVLGFLGPNGAGKTTTMQMLTGNLAPSAGGVEICGIDLLEQPVAAKARVGYLPETPPLYKDLTVDEYLRLAARLHRVARAGLTAAVEKAKGRCGIADVGQRLIGTLSKGYQQRVGIAQAIVHEPDVVILDEPTVGLDPNQIREIRALIRELGGDHSVILSTHILPEVESVCDRVEIMNQGAIVYSDSIVALKRLERGDAIRIVLRKAPPAQEIGRIPGIGRVEALGEGRFRVHREGEADPVDTLVRACVDRGWGLAELRPDETRLEDVFVRLTRTEDA